MLNALNNQRRGLHQPF